MHEGEEEGEKSSFVGAIYHNASIVLILIQRLLDARAEIRGKIHCFFGRIEHTTTVF